MLKHTYSIKMFISLFYCYTVCKIEDKKIKGEKPLSSVYMLRFQEGAEVNVCPG